MKKYLILILIVLSFIEHGRCQQTASFLKTNRKLEPIDSFDYLSKIQYFSIIPANREDYILSVDEGKIKYLYGPPYISANYNYLKIPVILTNVSETTLSYFSMSCSWQDTYITDNANLRIFSPGTCYTNFEVVLSILPHQHIERDIIVGVTKEKSMALVFRIGMVLQKQLGNNYSIDAKPTQIFFSIPGKKRLIWSNYIVISEWSTGRRQNKYSLGLWNNLINPFNSTNLLN